MHPGCTASLCALGIFIHAIEGHHPIARHDGWRGSGCSLAGTTLALGESKTLNKGAAQRAAVCTSMESEALPKMASILRENAFPRRQLLGIRLSKMDRHQTEPMPASGKGVLCPCLPG
jgi:hypothetical protein